MDAAHLKALIIVEQGLSGVPSGVFDWLLEYGYIEHDNTGNSRDFGFRLLEKGEQLLEAVYNVLAGGGTVNRDLTKDVCLAVQSLFLVQGAPPERYLKDLKKNLQPPEGAVRRMYMVGCVDCDNAGLKLSHDGGGRGHAEVWAVQESCDRCVSELNDSREMSKTGEYARQFVTVPCILQLPFLDGELLESFFQDRDERVRKAFTNVVHELEVQVNKARELLRLAGPADDVFEGLRRLAEQADRASRLINQEVLTGVTRNDKD